MHQYKNHDGITRAYGDIIDGRYERALAELRAIEQAGDQGACLYLGWMYENGFGVETDQARAAAYYDTLATINDPVGWYPSGNHRIANHLI